MADMKLKCVDCGSEFVFTEGEQNHFQEKGLHQPKRCKPCRQLRKQATRSQGG